MPTLGWFGLALVVGALMPVQAAVNARLGERIGGPLWAALVSFAVGTLTLAVVLGVRRAPLPSLAGVSAWALTGGLMGAFYVATMAAAVPRIGSAVLIALLVAGEIVASLALDASGLLPAERAVGVKGVAGALLIVAGVVLVARR